MPSEGMADLNPIQRENAQTGTVEWRLTKPAMDREIEGYASRTSVNRGDAISLFVHAAGSSYTMEVYRMGWYGGLGARLVFGPVIRRAVSQPMPSMDSRTGFIECSWTDPYILAVGSEGDHEEWVSGVYLA
ncbi:MAG: N,N-dimethylformamidase beta subunit family domain-containing protein, partial [Nitrospiraceae bacterium]